MSAPDRELLLAALRAEPTPRVPWIPYVGCHGGRLLGRSAADYLTSVDLLAAGLAAAAEQYRPDGLPVLFDLQIEAEAIGCRLAWADETPPAVVSHPLAEGLGLDDLALPTADSGRLRLAFEAVGAARRAVGPDIALFGLLTGPFTLALHLLGSDIFLRMFEQPDEVRAVLEYCRQVGALMLDGYLDAGADVIAVVDPMTSQISPRHFEQFVAAPAGALFDAIRARGALSAFFVCGDAQRNVAAMCATRPDAVFVDENIDLTYVAEIARPRGLAFGGNLPLTTVLLFGTPDDCRRAARSCLDQGGTPGYILAPGCDVPYAVPPENLAAVAEVVHGEHSGLVAASGATVAEVALPDYSQPGRVRLDVFTLDSLACAPCQYMVEAVRASTPEFAGRVEWIEHKLKSPATVGLMQALGVRSIPSIAIDGEVAFSSLIPDEPSLKEAIRRRLEAKGR